MTLSQLITQEKKQHVFFDFDETIIRLNYPWHLYIDRLHELLRGVDPSLYERLTEKNQPNIDDMTNVFVEKHGKSLWQRARAIARDFEENNLESYDLNPELIADLPELAAGRKLYIWTSNFAEVVTPILEQEQLFQYFEFVIGKGEVQYTKPNPDGFSVFKERIYPDDPQAADDLTQYLMVGNSSSDRGAAEAAGIDFYLIDYFTRV